MDIDEVNEDQRGQSYAALLQSLGVDSSLQHRKKRRRVEQVQTDTTETIHQSTLTDKSLSTHNIDADDQDVVTLDVNGHTQTTGSEV